MTTTRMLPPTPRDLDIHRLALIERASTRHIAEKYGLSQTRVRQIIYRVCDWLAETLPLKTDARKEQEANLAQHLAAAQLNHQIEQLQILWDQTFNPKYIRQQTRIITALARLGTIPGAIDSLAADITDNVVPSPNVVPSGPEGADAEHDFHSDSTSHTDSVSTRPSPHDSVSDLPHSPPPFEDCSPEINSNAAPAAAVSAQLAPTASASILSDDDIACFQREIEGLNVLERRLLIVLQNDFSENPDERQGIENSLAKVRQSKAAIELKIAPYIVGATVSVETPTVSPTRTASLSLNA
jgi:hypothetical protein